MNGAHDWSAELTSPETVRMVLGSPPPPLSDYELTSVLTDEREASVTLRFFAFAVPAGAAQLWRERGHNAVEFVLLCLGVTNLEVDAWSGWPTTTATLTGKTVVLGGRGKQVSFQAARIRAESPIGWLASRAQ
ncbi:MULTISPECIES: Imm50 family immunity protein [unclassified Kitasatospora]|uniref:Imm50 family immunity protein n=1 Tax=unclassified Kitasatospora TaxID=2633591 RepID=UPI0033C44354